MKIPEYIYNILYRVFSYANYAIVDNIFSNSVSFFFYIKLLKIKKNQFSKIFNKKSNNFNFVSVYF